MRVRLPYVPSTAQRAALNVLLSHRSTEFDRAQAFGRRLSRLGFTVRLLAPGELSPRSDKELTETLGNLILETDICCALVSADAAVSEWVRFEYQEAAAIFGRVIFLLDPPRGGEVGFQHRSSHARPKLAALQVKHTTLLNSASDEVLLVELCNDPDEAWFDGTESYNQRTSRNLKVESEIRKFVRSCLMYDPRYAGKTIVDVIPFSWDDSPTRDRDEVFRWVLDSLGRGDLRRSLSRGEIDGFLARYLVPHVQAVASVLGQEDSRFAHALVFTVAAKGGES